MCGRFTLFASMPVLSKMFDAPGSGDLAPRYNIAPSQTVLAVRTSPATGLREFLRARWGLVPSWSKDPSIGNRLINARSETVHVKPAFRSAFRDRRCLVPASGFYEWRRIDGRKQPYFIRMRDGSPFALAGLWEPGKEPREDSVGTCAILTTESNSVVSPLHDRMPVIIGPERYQRWLAAGTGSQDSLMPLFAPWPAEGMEAWPVGPGINNPRIDDEECVAPFRGTVPPVAE
jgi:putative SOS response-associated peptidase YedK